MIVWIVIRLCRVFAVLRVYCFETFYICFVVYVRIYVLVGVCGCAFDSLLILLFDALNLCFVYLVCFWLVD